MSLTATEFFSLSAEDFDPAIEASFYGKLKMRNCTFKLTCASRFAEIENAFMKVFSDVAPKLEAVLDIGVSTGITTVEFADFLRSKNSPASFTATDLFIDAHIVEPIRGLLVLADPTGWPLQYDFHGLPIRPWIRRLDYVSLAFIPLTLAKAVLRPRLQQLIVQGQSRPVRLISTIAKARTDIAFIEDDILERSMALQNKFDFARAANILNRNYFTDAELRQAIGNIRSYLRGPGAMLLVTRTNAALSNAGTLFELDVDKTFKIVARVGGGSEIETLVVEQY